MAQYQLDGNDFFVPLISEICWQCRWFDRDNPFERKCPAFPVEIPLEIWQGGRNHDEPYPNDNGLRFVHYKSEPITSQNIIDARKNAVKDYEND